jgi:hypothetical protein
MENYRFYKCTEISNAYVCDQIETGELYMLDITKPSVIVIDKMIPEKLDEIVIKYQLGFSTPIFVRKSK